MGLITRIIGGKKDLKEFDSSKILLKDGEMTSMIFENSNVGVKRAHFWNISIPFHSFEFDGKNQDTALVMDFTRIRDGGSKIDFEFSYH
jgi:hypothetical protein